MFLAHAALTDIAGKKHYQEERTARGVLDIAGVKTNRNTTTIFVRNWLAEIAPNSHSLKVDVDDFSFDLTLLPKKQAVLHGDSGYSQKGLKPESASCYYSLTRLHTTGTVNIGQRKHAVHGYSWMDHEFSSAPLEDNISGWDWFSIQLNDNTELMIYILRQKNGNKSPASSGSFVTDTDEVKHLDSEDFTIKSDCSWKSLHTGAVYPSCWFLEIRSLSIVLKIVPNLNDQEMRTPGSTGVSYWEGSVGVSGRHGGNSVKGFGYVELTGYEKPFNAPM